MLISNRIIVMKYSDLFKYRSVWMGFAISWIFFYHMGFDITIPVISQFKQIGYAGCDIFLFASGLGIYYSLDNNDDVLVFEGADCIDAETPSTSATLRMECAERPSQIYSP